MEAQFLRDYYRCYIHILVQLPLVLVVMRMSKAFRIGKYPSVLVFGTYGVEFSTHEHAWISSAIVYEKSVKHSERSLAALKCLEAA